MPYLIQERIDIEQANVRSEAFQETLEILVENLMVSVLHLSVVINYLWVFGP